MFGERMVYNKKGEPVNGNFIIYSKDTIKEREGFCINGKPEGEVKVYDLEGHLTIIANFKAGKPDGYTCYYKNDIITSTEKYSDGTFVEVVK